MKLVGMLVIITRLSLGGLFVYAGIQKFIPKPPRISNSEVKKTPENVVKMSEFIGGMKNTDYFWPLLGITEILCGILLISQYYSLLGSVMLLPVTLNIFLFHLFLKPDDFTDLMMSGLYFAANIGIALYHYPQLKQTFLTRKLI